MRFIVILLALSAHAGIIISPEQANPKLCWVFLLPPQTVQRATRDFLAQIALRTMNNKELGVAAKIALDHMAGLHHGKIKVRIDDKLKSPLEITRSELRLSVETAEKLLRPEATDPARITGVETGANLDPKLAEAWLDQAAALTQSNLWDLTVARLKWKSAFEGKPAPEIDALGIARSLWPPGSMEDSARKFSGGDPLEGQDDKFYLEVLASMNDFRTLFLELGRRATLPKADSYNELYGVLARKLGSGIETPTFKLDP